MRSASGHRRYHRSSLRRIAFVVFAQRIGFSLEEIAEQLARLPSRHVPTGGDWQRMSRVWKQRLDERIGELQRLSDSLDQCIGCGCLSLRHCVLHNPVTCARKTARARAAGWATHRPWGQNPTAVDRRRRAGRRALPGMPARAGHGTAPRVPSRGTRDPDSG